MPRGYWFLARRIHSLHPRSLNRYVKLLRRSCDLYLVSPVMLICISIILPILYSYYQQCTDDYAFCFLHTHVIPSSQPRADISVQVQNNLLLICHPILQLPSRSSHLLLNQWYLGCLRPQFTIVRKGLCI